MPRRAAPMLLLYKVLGAAGVAAILITGAYVKGRLEGRAAANLEWGTKLAKAEAEWRETQRLAQEQAFRTIDRLITEQEALDALMAQLRDEAATDPDAARGGINRDGVRRVGKIR